GQVQNVLERQPAEEPITCVLPTGPIEATLCDFETIDSVNEELFENVHALVETPGFKYFKADLYRTCPFWPEEGMCTEASCSITSIDESEVPEKWRVAALSKVKPVAVDDSHKLEGCYYRDSDFCFLDDENEGEYYDLSQIPERYTGYSGGDAARVWRAIYQENCFGLTELDFSPTAGGTLDLDDKEKCLEKRVYYKVISGLHASISTHICDEMLDLNTGEWKPDLKCFIYRVASHPERLHNMYFNAVLLLRAVSRLEPFVFDYCSSGTAEDDAETRLRLERVMSIAHKVGKFEENALFRGNDAKMLKEEFKSHFRNVTRIMDCTGCDKCRLWGKVQSMGLATALKILFEMDEQALNPRADSNLLQRSEVVALMNTVHRISESLHMVHRFRRMWRGTSATESEEMVSQVE
ncbi:endoplasmic oxidoreductin-1, partial [Fistulina hepatica ATCC 64428]